MEKILRPWSFMDFTKFVTPSILSIIFISLYMVIDAIFVSRFVGPLGMAAVSIVMPLFGLVWGVGIMMGAGASAIIGIEIGEGQRTKALQHFGLTFCFVGLLVLLVPILSYGFGIEKIVRLLGASEAIMPYASDYLRILIYGLGLVGLQVFFEFFIRLDGKPVWALVLAGVGGIVNIGLDYLFIVVLEMGIIGAAYASVAGILAAVLLGIYYFLVHSETLFFTKPCWDIPFLFRSMVNGSSELVTECSAAVKTIAFNYVMLRYAGEAGVAAMAILMFIYLLLASFHIGLSMGFLPLLSVCFGAKKFSKIREIVGRSGLIAGVASILSAIFAYFYGWTIVDVFAHGQDEVIALAGVGIKVMSLGILVCGINILGSGFFTSMGNGKISAFIAFCNSIVFTLIFIYVFPKYFGLTGIWWVVPSAEICAGLLTVVCFYWTRKRYITGQE